MYVQLSTYLLLSISFHILKQIEFEGIILTNIKLLLTMTLESVYVMRTFDRSRQKSGSITVLEIEY